MARSKTVRRLFHRFDSQTRANLAASHRLGYLRRNATGEFFYVSDLISGICFRTRGEAEKREAEAKARDAA